MSPMIEQYRRIKRDHEGEVLFFRLGDFYEMFFEDAIEVSSLLNLTLTSRAGQPMCGIPYHAARTYISRLLRLGKKIAVCEQITEPGKGLIERRVVEIITAGTTVDEEYLDKGSSNYLACLAFSRGFFSFSYMDLSIGEFFATSFPPERAEEKVKEELERIEAKEIIIQESLLNDYPFLRRVTGERAGLVLNRWADWLFDPQRSRDRLEKQLGALKLKGFGLKSDSPEIVSAGALLDYLNDTSKSLLPHVHFLKVYGDAEYVGLDESTQRNLELVKNLSDGESRYTLLEVMDETKTAMGRRLLRKRILCPLRNALLINKRLDIVETLYHSQEKLKSLREILSRTPDLERLCSRLAMDKAHGKDMLAIKNALHCFRLLEQQLLQLDKGNVSVPPSATGDKGKAFCFESREAAGLMEDSFKKLLMAEELLEKGISEDPSILLAEGNLIKSGFSEELDKLAELRDSGRVLLEEYLEEEREATGIQGLKIRYNKLIGYFFEVTKVNLGKVPDYFIRRQGLSGGERYTTNRLAGLESEINGASGKMLELEKKLFIEIRDKVKIALPELSAAGKRIAELDAAQSLSRAATKRGWIRPAIDNSGLTFISEGRHPVVEAHLPPGEFIPNDLSLDSSDNESNNISFALITGPNMAGKSTYLRQAALIILMAQSGSFVPASLAKIGLVDRIFCRVGASDNLARGESTFLVEMNETAYILHTATEKSFVIMDEVGRGTGTEDGLSIAWAVCEDLLENIKCRTLFATHYHELSRIAHKRMANRSMDVMERDGEIVFLRKIKEGPTEESYGLHVASLAGLPERVLIRADEIMLSLLEQRQNQKTVIAKNKAKNASAKNQLTNKFDTMAGLIKNEISLLDVNKLTPLEALNMIGEWKKQLKNKPEPEWKSENKPLNDNPSLFDLNDK